MNASQATGATDTPAAWWNSLTAELAAGRVTYSDALGSDIIACIKSGEVHPITVADNVLNILRTIPRFSEIAAPVDAFDVPRVAALAESGEIVAAFDNDLARFLIANVVVRNPGFELMLTQARRALLMAFMRDATTSSATRDFLAALAQHCFLTEYAYWEEPDETLWADVLSASAEAMAAEGDANTDVAVALLGCYRPLVPWPGESPLSFNQIGTYRTTFEHMWVRLVEDRNTELALMETFPTLAEINDPTSRAVRGQYEENPYPRWQLPFLPPSLPPDIAARQMFPAANFDTYEGGAEPRILIAGCGTGFMTNSLAKLFGGQAKITAIDLSRASLAYAARTSRALGHEIDYAQADILSLPPSLGAFDIIECGGVLHHTKDPFVTWQALCNHLAPGGLMKVALYNRNGRDWLQRPRHMARAGSYKPTTKDIRRFRRDIIRASMSPSALPLGLQNIFTRIDFYSVSMCRDACFHIQESEYALHEIIAMAEKLKLSFLGLSFLSETTLSHYQRLFPGDPHARNVRFIEMFEEQEKDAAGSMYTLLFQKPAD